jgi:hypothetical protein
MSLLGINWPDWIDRWHAWAVRNEATVFWVTVTSVAMFVASLIIVPILLVKMPSDYFVRPHLIRLEGHWTLRVIRKVLKNLLGVVLAVIGLVMIPAPGQGVLTLLIGLTLLDYPGKRQCELRIVRKPTVLRAINWIRSRYGRPPILTDIPTDAINASDSQST